VNLGIGIQHLLEADHLLGGGGDVRINAGADPGEDGRAERWSATLSRVALVALAWYPDHSRITQSRAIQLPELRSR
jgi:hypothetical protein